MASTFRWWLPVAAAAFCVSLDATPASFSAKITSAEADDIGHDEVKVTVRYVVRAPKGSVVAVRHLRISGEELTPLPSSPSTETVGTLVLIDAGEPGHPHLSAKVQEWVKQLAAIRPAWTYRFIAGDDKGCLVSPELTDSKLQAALQQQLVRAPDQALTMPEYAPSAEDMEKMVALFGKRAHTLVVLAPEAPSWLPREVTEWMTRDVPLADRKPHGLSEQIRVRAADANAIHEIADWIRLGHLRVVLLQDGPKTSEQQAKAAPTKDASPKSADDQRAPMSTAAQVPSSVQLLRNGVEDILTGQKSPLTVEELAAEQSPELVEYRGTAVAPLTELQRLASGPYTADLEVAVDGVSSWTREAPVMDRAVKNWTPLLLQQYVLYIPSACLVILLFVMIIERVRRRQPFDQDFAETSRNCIFACAGLAFAIAANLTTTSASRLQYNACRAALVCGLAFVAFGVVYWIAYHTRRQYSKAMPPLNEAVNA